MHHDARIPSVPAGLPVPVSVPAGANQAMDPNNWKCYNRQTLMTCKHPDSSMPEANRSASSTSIVKAPTFNLSANHPRVSRSFSGFCHTTNKCIDDANKDTAFGLTPITSAADCPTYTAGHLLCHAQERAASDLVCSQYCQATEGCEAFAYSSNSSINENCSLYGGGFDFYAGATIRTNHYIQDPIPDNDWNCYVRNN